RIKSFGFLVGSNQPKERNNAMKSTESPASPSALPPGSEDPSEVGSLAWSQQKDPALDARQKGRLLIDGVTQALLEAPRELRWRLSRAGLLPAEALPEVGLTPLPDTKAVERSRAALEELAGPDDGEIIQHSYRTYYYAEILYRLSGYKGSIDHEVLAVAA